MRIATLDQIFGMLAATATLCGAETALAQNAAAALSALLLKRMKTRRGARRRAANATAI